MTRLFAVMVFSVGLSASSARGQEPVVPQKADGLAVPVRVMSEKQKKLMEDSETLVKLAAELKVSVDKSSKNELSLDVVRKAEAVEKLAKSVKERLREAR